MLLLTGCNLAKRTSQYQASKKRRLREWGFCQCCFEVIASFIVFGTHEILNKGCSSTAPVVFFFFFHYFQYNCGAITVAITCDISIPYGCGFDFQLLYFQSSSLLILGKAAADVPSASSLHALQGLDEALRSVLAVTDIWVVNQWMEDICVGVPVCGPLLSLCNSIK